MPIYAYRCNTCGHAQDILQKISDNPLTICTACGASTFAKQVTAAGFQLKGSGWYVTDFRNDQKKSSTADQASGQTNNPATATSDATSASSNTDSTTNTPSPAVNTSSTTVSQSNQSA